MDELWKYAKVCRVANVMRPYLEAIAGDSGKPRWPESMPADHIKPAAKRAGIGTFGWHTFRHTYSTLLHALGTAPAVQKELLRHANIQTTLNVYTQAVTADKRDAASKVAHALWRM